MKSMTTVTLVTLLLAPAGCTRGFKEGSGLFQEGKGDYQVLQEPTKPLTDFDNIQIGKFKAAYEKTPEALIPLMKSELAKQLRDKNQPIDSGGKRVLLVRGSITHYEESEEASGHVFGPLEEAIAQVELVDRKSGDVIARATCVGRSDASVSKGVETKADGLGEAIANWINRYRPVEKKD